MGVQKAELRVEGQKAVGAEGCGGRRLWGQKAVGADPCVCPSVVIGDRQGEGSSKRSAVRLSPLGPAHEAVLDQVVQNQARVLLGSRIHRIQRDFWV
jgi:hypothetical protein